MNILLLGFLLISNLSLGSATDAVVDCVKKVSMRYGNKTAAIACSEVESEADIKAVLECIKKLESNVGAKFGAKACSKVKN